MPLMEPEFLQQTSRLMLAMSVFLTEGKNLIPLDVVATHILLQKGVLTISIWMIGGIGPLHLLVVFLIMVGL